MNTFCKTAIGNALRVSIASLTLALPIVASADQPNDGRDRSPLIDKVRHATARYLNINAALNEVPEHWVVATPCVSGPNEGAMGVHLVKPSRLGVTDLKGDEPQALIYEPLPNGAFRLVGVEFIVFVDNFEPNHPPGVTPAVDGHLTNLVTA
ncbi:MAG TPA: hypothetical protein VET48_13835, partial [Steroidobacteraceae bacterium]|nr:hypothetical protein [Steroidobacteraceae bacterium]